MSRVVCGSGTLFLLPENRISLFLQQAGVLVVSLVTLDSTSLGFLAASEVESAVKLAERSGELSREDGAAIREGLKTLQDEYGFPGTIEEFIDGLAGRAGISEGGEFRFQMCPGDHPHGAHGHIIRTNNGACANARSLEDHVSVLQLCMTWVNSRDMTLENALSILAQSSRLPVHTERSVGRDFVDALFGGYAYRDAVVRRPTHPYRDGTGQPFDS